MCRSDPEVYLSLQGCHPLVAFFGITISVQGNVFDVVRLTMGIVGEELVLGKNQDRLARMVLYTILAGALTVFFLNM